MKIKPRTKKAIVLSVMVVLLVATGALMSTITNHQGDSIPAVAHLVEVERG